jgi:hypothetical protein
LSTQVPHLTRSTIPDGSTPYSFWISLSASDQPTEAKSSLLIAVLPVLQSSSPQDRPWSLLLEPCTPQTHLCNLISAGELRSDDAIVDGWKDQIVRRKTTHQELASLVWVSNVAVLRGVEIPKGQLTLSQMRMSSVSFDVMDQRLGHANKEAILRACRQSGITFPAREVADHHCEACYTSKA